MVSKVQKVKQADNLYFPLIGDKLGVLGISTPGKAVRLIYGVIADP